MLVAETRDSTFRAKEVDPMAFSQGMLEEIAAWCRDILELASARQEARSRFFGDDDERPVDYWPGAMDRLLSGTGF